jgi:hypothetical protein
MIRLNRLYSSMVCQRTSIESLIDSDSIDEISGRIENSRVGHFHKSQSDPPWDGWYISYD